MSVSVLNVYRTYFPDPQGGLQEAIRQICLSTSKLDIHNSIFTLSPNPYPQELQFPEATVVRCRSWAAPASCDLGDPRAFIEFSQLTSRADVLHYFHPWPFADVMHAVCKPKAPAVMTYISDVIRQRFLGKLYQPLMQYMLDQMKFIVVNAGSYVDSSPILGQPRVKRKIRVIPLGIDEASYPSMLDTSIFNKLSIEPDEPFFLFVGVLRYYKGLPFLIEAAKRLSVKVVIAGTGPEEQSLKNLASSRDFKNVIFAGHVSDAQKLALIHKCVALVLPSHLRSEAYGMVLVEASMCSKAMISCELGTGTSFVNQHNATGLVVRAGSAESLFLAMSELLADSDMTQAFGLAARKRYEQYFSGPAMGNAYAQLYRDC